MTILLELFNIINEFTYSFDAWWITPDGQLISKENIAHAHLIGTTPELIDLLPKELKPPSPEDDLAFEDWVDRADVIWGPVYQAMYKHGLVRSFIAQNEGELNFSAPIRNFSPIKNTFEKLVRQHKPKAIHVDVAPGKGLEVNLAAEGGAIKLNQLRRQLFQ